MLIGYLVDGGSASSRRSQEVVTHSVVSSGEGVNQPLVAHFRKVGRPSEASGVLLFLFALPAPLTFAFRLVIL